MFEELDDKFNVTPTTTQHTSPVVTKKAIEDDAEHAPLAITEVVADTTVGVTPTTGFPVASTTIPAGTLS